MRIEKASIKESNDHKLASHNEQLSFLKQQLQPEIDLETIISLLQDFQIAIPSWALGAGGTRFGRYSIGGEPSSLDEKICDVAIINDLTKSTASISLHIPWDVPEDSVAVKEFAASLEITFDAVNSNTFQDQPEQEYSYKFGSLSHIKKKVRNQAIDHNIQVIEYGKALGSKSITVWLADGTSFPGQSNFRTSMKNTQSSLKEIYNALPEDWKMLIEYKPYEPNFYSMVIPDWGTSSMLAEGCGENAFTLVDLGHHLPNTNIEQIVAVLILKEKLGGFHFNDSKYGDDDLTTGSVKPYQLFLIFNELVMGMSNDSSANDLAWMIDASHNIKDPLEDLMQSVEAIQVAYTQALLIDRNMLSQAQNENDVVVCQELLQNAFGTDVRPLVREARIRNGGSIDPLSIFREMNVREKLIEERGKSSRATGL